MSSKPRFNFYIDTQNRLLVVRPIGDIPGPEMAARVVAVYRSVEAPWTFNRIVELRRYNGYVAKEDRALIASAWAEITAGIEYKTHVAMVVGDRYEKLRLPEVCEQFPNETICYFLDYHEAVGWLLSVEKAQYLDELGEVTVLAETGGMINVE
jgi:hypothetical protein